MAHLTLPRLAAVACAGGILLLAACSRQPVRQASASPAEVRHPTHRLPYGTAATPAALPSRTGIPVCDAYLSTYIACHRAAGIFAPGQLQGHYEMMRDSLLRDSQDPDIRPQLANRCEALEQGLREALHGTSCDAPQPMPDPAPRR